MTTTSCPDSIHAAHFGVCRCDCVLVDVGLNDGQSLFAWSTHLLARFVKNNRSWQTPLRNRLQSCVQQNMTTCYYGFEANPAYDATLLSLESQLRAQGRRARLFRSVAFSTDARGAEFLVDTPQFKTEGKSSTLEPNNILVYRNWMGHWKVQSSHCGTRG